MQRKKIQTQRLLLVPFTEKYITSEYIDWLNDPIVVRYSELRHTKHTLTSCRKYLADLLESQNHFWAILLNVENPLHIGNISAHFDAYNKIADIGILLGARHAWNKGYGLEAWLAVCEYLIHDLNVRKITAGAMSDNQAMIKIMQSAGMKEDGRRKHHHLIDGIPSDIVHYCLFNEDQNS